MGLRPHPFDMASRTNRSTRSTGPVDPPQDDHKRDHHDDDDSGEESGSDISEIPPNDPAITSKKIRDNKNREFKIGALRDTFCTGCIKRYAAGNSGKTCNYRIPLDGEPYNGDRCFQCNTHPCGNP